MGPQIRQALLPAAGRGTRFLPITRAVPKEMLPVVDTPLIHHALEEAARAGVEECIIVTGPGKAALEAYLTPPPPPLTGLRLRFVRQDAPLGLGHAVWCARRMLDGPFAVLLPDDLLAGGAPGSLLTQMMAVHERTGGNVVAVEDVPRERTAHYGILDPEHTGDAVITARGIVEKPAPDTAPSTWGVIGRYILAPGILEDLDRAVTDDATGAGGEIQLTDALARGLKRCPLHGVRFTGVRHDCGTPQGLLAAALACALQRSDMAQDAQAMLADAAQAAQAAQAAAKAAS